MRLPIALGFVAAIALTAGCANVMGPTAACGGEDSEALVADIFREAIEEATRAAISERGAGSYSASKIRATAAELKFTLKDVRTTKDDPDSTKKFCAATLKLAIPAAAVQDASRARTSAGEGDLGALADEHGVTRSANAFSDDIEFSVQPTDEGDKLYAETENEQKLVEFAAQVLSWHLLSSKIRDEVAEQSRLQAEQVAAEQQTEREAMVAAEEQKQAVLGEAKAENDLARQTINAVWTSVPKGAWGPVTGLQKAWVRRKEADCNVEAAAASVDATEKETARLRCDTRITVERIGWLRQNRPQSEETEEESTF